MARSSTIRNTNIPKKARLRKGEILSQLRPAMSRPLPGFRPMPDYAVPANNSKSPLLQVPPEIRMQILYFVFMPSTTPSFRARKQTRGAEKERSEMSPLKCHLVSTDAWISALKTFEPNGDEVFDPERFYPTTEAQNILSVLLIGNHYLSAEAREVLYGSKTKPDFQMVFFRKDLTEKQRNRRSLPSLEMGATDLVRSLRLPLVFDFRPGRGGIDDGIPKVPKEVTKWYKFKRDLPSLDTVYIDISLSFDPDEDFYDTDFMARFLAGACAVLTGIPNVWLVFLNKDNGEAFRDRLHVSDRMAEMVTQYYNWKHVKDMDDVALQQAHFTTKPLKKTAPQLMAELLIGESKRSNLLD